MTNTEAIETLKANYPDACYEQLREAVDTAMVALKAQNTSGDTISRQAAIDAINRAVTKEVARWSVEELPSAEVEPVCEYWDSESHFCALHRPAADAWNRRARKGAEE